MMMVNLPPPPTIPQPKPPIDLGLYDPAWVGWFVVINPLVPLSVNDLMGQMAAESTADVATKMEALAQWVSMAILAWNFVDARGHPLPQPADGGAKLCPYALIEPLSHAFAEAIRPSPNS